MAELTGATEVLCQLAGSQHTDQDECSLVCKGRDSGIAYRVVVDGGEADRVRVASTLSRHFETVDEVLNAWNPTSALSALNAAAPGEWVAAPDALLSVCREVDWLHGHTAGLFDPTVASVARACGIGPPPVAAEAAAATAPPVGWRQCVEVSYATRRVRRTKAGVVVDLCGVAKGWWVDCVVEALQDLGHSEIYVEWGGDVRCVGAWEVAVVRPGAAAGAGAAGFAGRVAVANACVATSGDYVKTRKAEGGGAGLVNENAIHPFKRVPMPVCAGGGGGGGIASVTVASTSCARADGLATAFMLAEQMPQLLSTLLAPSSPLLGVLDAQTGGVIVQTRGGGTGTGTVDPQAWSDNGGGGVFSAGSLRSVLPPSAATATAGETPSANLERLAIHKHCRDLVKTTPKQLYWLSIEGGFAVSESPPASPSSTAAAGSVGIVVSSLVVLPGGGRCFFALMKPSLMQREVEARLRRTEDGGGGPALRLNVYPLRTPPPLPLPLGYDPVACGAVDARACARVCVERVEDVGDHLAVVACDEDRAGGAVEVPVSPLLPPAAAVVVRQHGTAFAVRPAPLPSGGVKARSPGLAASGSSFVDSPCVVYNTSRLPSGDALRGERRVARGLRLLSMVPYVVCFVLEGGRHDAGGWAADGDTLRLHVLDSHQHALVDLAARRESEVQKIKLRAMDGFILPSELGFIDCCVTAVSREGVVFATPSVSVALSRPPEAALLVSYAPRADAVGVQIPHPDLDPPVWPLVAAVLTRLGLSAVVVVIFYLWCVAPFMIQP